MVAIEELFSQTRFPPGLMFFLMLLYFPVGIFLVVCRFLIMLHTYLIVCLLPAASARRQTVRVMLGVVGIHVIVDEDKRDASQIAKVLVSNSTSVLDHIIIDVLINNIVPYEGGVPSIFQKLLGYKDLGSGEGREKFIQNLKTFCQGSIIPLFLQPEGTPTNNTVGLLQFNSLPFELELPVQPIAIQVSRFSFPCALSTIESPRWTDVLWCFFTPVTVFNIKILPLEQKLEEETVEVFAERVRGIIAETLRLQTTNYTSTDKAEYMKNLKRPAALQLRVPGVSPVNGGNGSPHPSSSSASPADSANDSSILSRVSEEMRQMIQQVHGVLPQVPYLAIKHDLDITQDVDITISNILEGRVIYTPIEPASPNTQTQAKQTGSSAVAKPTTDILKNSTLFKASSFPVNPNARHLSLKERKQAMLEMARQRYKAKHGLL